MMKLFLFISLFLAISGSVNGQKTNLESLQISKIFCDFPESTFSSENQMPRFSWIVSANQRGLVQKAYQIDVASKVENIDKEDIGSWSSGKVLSDETLNIPFAGKSDVCMGSFFYRITVWDNRGHSASKTGNYFAKRPENGKWRAKWIGSGEGHDQLPPKGFYSGAKGEGKSGDSIHHDGRSLLLRHTFQIKGKVRSAKVFVTGLGLYELLVNGKKIGDQVLSPAKTPYHKQILYDHFDLTGQLVTGTNAIGIHLGNGWYNPYKKWWQEYRMQWFGHKKAILQLEVEYANGNKEMILTDESWKAAPGPSLFNCIYDGEVYDATREVKGWAEAAFDDSSWKAAVVSDSPRGKLMANDMPPVRIVERITAKKIATPKPNVKIYDFGQNFAGWCALTLNGKPGTRIRIRYAEELDKTGNLDVTCNENAGATAEYVLRGDGVEVFEPRFTFFGFQYAEITSDLPLPEILMAEGCVIHSDNPPSGSFSCDNELINQIHHATVWSQKSNMLGYPMDCPQRDERLGWMGDAQVTSEEALFNFDMARFYRNWFSGIRANQDSATGDIPIISPRPYIRDDGVEWSSSYLTMVWDCYRYYGDKQLIAEHYGAMSRYFRFLVSQGKDLIQPKGWIGDWGSLAKGWKEGDPESIPTAYFYLDAVLLSKMAGVTGQKADSLYYAVMAEKIRKAYHAHFFHDDSNNYHDGSQMANAFPLYLGLVPQDKRELVFANLVRQILVTDSGHLTTGVLGTKYLPEVLSGYGRPDITWLLVNQKGYPSWSEMMKKYNTLCEFWTLKQSHNHVMMGSIDSWFYENLAGIGLSEEFPAYKRTVIHPYFAKGLNHVDCTLQTVRGKLISGWERSGSTLKMKLEIPFNCSSEVWIPADSNSRIMESGKPVESKKEITLLRKEGDFVVFFIGSGSYLFEVRYPAEKF